MSNEEDDELGRQRERDQKELSETRQRRFITKILDERRDEFWIEHGFRVSTDKGMEKLSATLNLPAALDINVADPDDVKEKREALAWAVRAQKRAATFGTRLMSWSATAIGIVLGIIGIIKYLQEWKGH